MDDLPSWEVPKELDGPSHSTSNNIAVILLSCSYLTNEIYDLVGAYVSQHALSDIWFVTSAKRTLSPRELLGIVNRYDQLDRAVYEAWKELERCVHLEISPEELRPKVLAAKDDIAAALENAVTIMRQTRENG